MGVGVAEEDLRVVVGVGLGECGLGVGYMRERAREEKEDRNTKRVESSMCSFR